VPPEAKKIKLEPGTSAVKVEPGKSAVKVEPTQIIKLSVLFLILNA
jgi:hypothetical protein